MIDRRQFAAGFAALSVSAMLPGRAAAELSEDGLHIQPFFMQTFLAMAEDREEAEAAGKHFAVIFEQRGCPYCKEMHEVNFARPEIADYVAANFGIVQINLWGSREVTDFDGEAMEEKALARKWNVNFTPTIVFFGKGGEPKEVIRMPGYFKPFHFVSMFEYVAEDRYGQEDFQRFLQARFDKLEAEGKKPDLW
ncbi:MAG: thioredoxin family protein [Oricola sp.]